MHANNARQPRVVLNAPCAKYRWFIVSVSEARESHARKTCRHSSHVGAHHATAPAAGKNRAQCGSSTAHLFSQLAISANWFTHPSAAAGRPRLARPPRAPGLVFIVFSCYADSKRVLSDCAQ